MVFLLDALPVVKSFLGMELKVGSQIIAALGVIHPMAYGCSFFIPLSYLTLTIWMFLVLYFCASAGLMYAVYKDDQFIMCVWIWYTIIFICAMVILLGLMATVFSTRQQGCRVCVIILGLLWYLIKIYFILVVNSHRRELDSNIKIK